MTDKILIDRSVVEQALRAFEAWDARGRLRVMAALRAALEQPQVEKRVAWLPLDGRGGYTSSEPQVEQELDAFYEWWHMRSSLTRLQAWLLWKDEQKQLKRAHEIKVKDDL